MAVERFRQIVDLASMMQVKEGRDFNECMAILVESALMGYNEEAWNKWIKAITSQVETDPEGN